VPNPRREIIDDRLLMRLARETDKDALLNWRNNPGVVQFTRTQASISIDAHAHWFKERLRILNLEPIFIFTLDETPIGMTRLDRIESERNGYEVSILVDEQFQNAGVGKLILLRTCEFGKDGLSATFIRAEIHNKNLASIKLFTKLGFVEKSKVDDNFSSYDFSG